MTNSKNQNGRLYAFTDQAGAEKGWIKVGYTSRDDVTKRIREQQGTGLERPKLLGVWDATGPDGEKITDHKVHRRLQKMGIRRIKSNKEWFACKLSDVEAAIKSLQTGVAWQPERLLDFPPRPEQQRAIDLTARYFRENSLEKTGRKPRYLWNAKMRFGKSFAALKLALELGHRRICIGTYKTAVEDSWLNDLLHHKDFEGFQLANRETRWEDLDPDKPIVWFVSFQDMLGNDSEGNIKERHRPFFSEQWDLLILDEYHFGAWREVAREIYESDPSDLDPSREDISEEAISKQIHASNLLFLSGTPFRALSDGSFSEDQVFSWTYPDEQRAKEEWDPAMGTNPYLELPQVLFHLYEIPGSIRQIAARTDRNEFDIGYFFAADKVVDKKTNEVSYKFKHEQHVQNFLDLLTGSFLPSNPGQTASSFDKSLMPFASNGLLEELLHTLWFLPSVNSCRAMAELMAKPQNSFYHQFEVVVAAGNEAGMGADALKPVREAIGDDPTSSRSITLSCGKLTTGVTVPEWNGVLMLRNTSSPETYLQAAFRAQSPWTRNAVDGERGQYREILKEQCHVIDFVPNRALSLIQANAVALDPDPHKSAEAKVEEYTKYLPILSYRGGSFEQLDGRKIMDTIISGTTSTALARRFQSSDLISVDAGALSKLLDSKSADLIERLEKLESFRNLRKDADRMINLESRIKRLKTKKESKKLTKKEKTELSAAEKELRKRRDEIRTNLLKFTTKLPLFMCLSEKREETLLDVIENVEPDLFEQVTGLTV